MVVATLYDYVAWLLLGGLRAHEGVWRMDARRVEEAEARLAMVVGRPTAFGGGQLPAWALRPDDPARRAFPLAVLLFGAVLRSGWSMLVMGPGTAGVRWAQGRLVERQWARVCARQGSGYASYGACRAVAGEQAILAD